jgi:hypothetical protein
VPEVVESLDVPPMPPVPPLELVPPEAPDEDPLDDGVRFVDELPVPPELPLFAESFVTLGIDPVPFEPLFIVSELVVLPDPLVVPLMPLPLVPLPLVPPELLPLPDDCAYANPTPAANTAAARLALILVAFIMFSSLKFPILANAKMKAIVAKTESLVQTKDADSSVGFGRRTHRAN